MKKVIQGKDLQSKMLEAINLLCGTVKATLGPKGSNVIIDHSQFSPFITNDGVTIASQIESDDPIINTILELAKESSVKTNEMVGDGTTTTLVLLESLFINGIKMINEGINPIILKKELDEASSLVLANLKKLAHQPRKKDWLSVGTISGKDLTIGQNLSKAFQISNDILIKEGIKEFDEVIIKNGYIIESILGSIYFLKNSCVKH